MQYPQTRHFAQEMFSRLARLLWNTGNVQPIQAPLKKILTFWHTWNTIPILSTSKMSNDMEVPKIIVHEILQENNGETFLEFLNIFFTILEMSPSWKQYVTCDSCLMVVRCNITQSYVTI